MPKFQRAERYGVVLGLRTEWVSAVLEFLEVAKAITIWVSGSVAFIVRIEAVVLLPVIRHTIAIQILTWH
jgi:hypothetical protein